MILSHIMKHVKIKRDYEIEIDLSISCEELGLSLDSQSFSDIAISA
jgi:hypothetical protein